MRIIFAGMVAAAGWPRWLIVAVLIGAALLVFLSARPYDPAPTVYTRTAQETGQRLANDKDAYLYRDIVARVSAGSSYWDAAAAEHRRHHAPTAPAIVFRQPGLTWLLAALRTPNAASIAQIALAILTSILTWAALTKTGLNAIERAAAVCLQFTALGYVVLPLAIYSHELWAGLLLASSLAAWRLGHLLPAIVLALLACLLRELALPFLLAMAFCSAAERRWRDAGAWLAATVVFVGLFAIHMAKASQLHLPTDAVSPGWMHIGGLGFAVRAAQTNLVLAPLPAWVTSAVVVSSIIGLALCRDKMFRRCALIIVGYLAAFTIIGRPENAYWGLLISPLIPFGVALMPRTCFGVWQGLAGQTRQTTVTPPAPH